MNTLMILVGPDADSNPYLMDLASIAAGLAMESDRQILFAGTSQAALAVGTALVGNQQGRTVEGGKRVRSPMTLAGVIRSNMDTLDPLCQDSDRRETDSNGEMPQYESGLLSDLIDLGVMDLPDLMEGGIVPRSIEELTFQVNRLLKQEEPSQTLVIGNISGDMLQSLFQHAKESKMKLKIIGDRSAEGAKTLYSEVAEPLLDGAPIRDVEQNEPEEFRGETDFNPLFEAAKNAALEAGLSHEVTVWVLGKEQSRNLEQ